MTTIEVQTTTMAVGGEAVAREADGRVVFTSGALPGERVRVQIDREKKRFAHGHVIEVLEPAADRVTESCPQVAQGCGGCDWQHIEEAAQHRLRLDIVRGVLARDAKIEDPQVTSGPSVPAEGVRTTVRGSTDAQGRFAFRRRRSHDPVLADPCLIAHPLVAELLAEGRFGNATEVTVRAGARTGERLVLVKGDPSKVQVPDDVLVAGTRNLRAGHRAWYHEEAAGRRWRISADSFFQASAEGAEALVSAVGGYVEQHAAEAERLVDLCCGVGLFAGTVGAGRKVIGVERAGSSVADARHNLADGNVRLVKVPMAHWRPDRADVVIADPARSGLEAVGVAAVAATGAQLCVLVSCDPGSLGRDARLLGEAGYRHAGSQVLDLFGHTSHIEVVSAFIRS